MTRQEFETWIEEHYDELIAVAYARTRQIGPKRDQRGRALDTGQAGAQQAVQEAATRALKSKTLRGLDTIKAWPWMVDAVRSTVFHARAAEVNAETSLQSSPAFLSTEQDKIDGRYVGPIKFGSYPLTLTRCTCREHQQWLRGEKVHKPGCRTEQIVWVEAGEDRLPTSGRKVAYIYAALACLNGGREYLNIEDIERLSVREPAHASGFDDQELLRDAKRVRPARCTFASAFERKTNTDNSPRPMPEGAGLRLVCADCDAANNSLWSCEHATTEVR